MGGGGGVNLPIHHPWPLLNVLIKVSKYRIDLVYVAERMINSCPVETTFTDYKDN